MFSCIYRSQEPASITQFILENAQTIIRINDLESFKSDIESNEIISQISYLKQLNDDEQVLQHIQTINPILITLDKDAKEYTLITKFNDSLFPNSSLDSIGIHHQVVDSIFIASSSVDFNSQRLQKRTDLNFNKIHNSSNTNQCFSIYYKDGATIQTTDAFIGEMDLPFSAIGSGYAKRTVCRTND